METTPRIELGVEVLQFVAGLLSGCNQGQAEYEPDRLRPARYNRIQPVRQKEWQHGAAQESFTTSISGRPMPISRS